MPFSTGRAEALARRLGVSYREACRMIGRKGGRAAARRRGERRAREEQDRRAAELRERRPDLYE